MLKSSYVSSSHKSLNKNLKTIKHIQIIKIDVLEARDYVEWFKSLITFLVAIVSSIFCCFYEHYRNHQKRAWFLQNCACFLKKYVESSQRSSPIRTKGSWGCFGARVIWLGGGAEGFVYCVSIRHEQLKVRGGLSSIVMSLFPWVSCPPSSP